MSDKPVSAEPDWHEFYTQSQIALYHEQEVTESLRAENARLREALIKCSACIALRHQIMRNHEYSPRGCSICELTAKVLNLKGL